jgi:hypothetical protein
MMFKPDKYNLPKKPEKLSILILAVAFFQVSVSHAQEKPNLKEGSWRVAIQMTVPNATGPATGPMQYDRCLTPGNVKTLLAMPAGTPCTLRESKLTSDDLTWKMSCSQSSYHSVVNGKINFRDTTLDGEIITVAQGPQKVRITTKIAGRYLGKCVNVNPPPAPTNKNTLPKFKE